ncbi:MAG: sodium:proton antiporter [Phycisphaerales bacterium]|nr:sodium:proton antiporter [Phycisphaerales bacterium]
MLPAPPALAAQAVPIWLIIPFAAMLLSIAIAPLLAPKFWHRRYPVVALALGAVVAAVYLLMFGAHGRHVLLHTGIEYVSFIALIASLFIASGGVLIRVRARNTPLSNTILLAIGAVLANLIGTTGASVLLIRPYMRMTAGRLRPLHIVFFIFIVSNCGGALTPIGDPPLYLGYLKGVPFFWTFEHLRPMWFVANFSLLAFYYLADVVISRRLARLGKLPPSPSHDPAPHPAPHLDDAAPVQIQGFGSILFLLAIVAAVFIDPLLAKYAGISGYPIGAAVQLALAVAAYKLADPDIHAANRFDFAPVKEVAYLFAGIFITMAPALEYVAAHADQLGVESPTNFYFATGLLSSALDNAPTYLTFLQLALGLEHLELSPGGIATLLADPGGASTLSAISLGAVFFGAMTYIGNGPNFMVKSIAEEAGVKMPSFFAYILYALCFLLPVLVLVWAIFLR